MQIHYGHRILSLDHATGRYCANRIVNKKFNFRTMNSLLKLSNSYKKPKNINNEKKMFPPQDARAGRNGLLCDRGALPEGLREPFINTGYRKPYSTNWQCVQSLFYLNNESFNIWSHVLVTLYFFVRYSVVLTDLNSSPSGFFYYPMLSSAIGTLTVYFSSVIAHLFSSKSPSLHDMCFLFDYAGVSTYAFTSGQVMYYYTRPVDTKWMIFESPALYTATGAILSFVATYTCGQSKVSFGNSGSLMRVTSMLFCWCNTIIPLFFGLTLCSCDPVAINCKSFAACSTLIITYYQRHCLCSIIAGVIYGTYLPERLLPGTFDFIGNSHHFLHIFSALSTEYAFKILEEVLRCRKDPKNEILAKSLNGMTVVDGVGPTIVVLIGNLAIAYWYAKPLFKKASKLNKNK